MSAPVERHKGRRQIRNVLASAHTGGGGAGPRSGPELDGRPVSPPGACVFGPKPQDTPGLSEVVGPRGGRLWSEDTSWRTRPWSRDLQGVDESYCVATMCLFRWQEGCFLTAGDSLRGLRNQTQKTAPPQVVSGQRRLTRRPVTLPAPPSDQRQAARGPGAAQAPRPDLTHAASHVSYAGRSLKLPNVGRT